MKQLLIIYLVFAMMIYGTNNDKLAQTGFQFLSYAGLLQSVTMDLGNTVEYRELVGAASAK